jgi:hypothetical protein
VPEGPSIRRVEQSIAQEKSVRDETDEAAERMRGERHTEGTPPRTPLSRKVAAGAPQLAASAGVVASIHDRDPEPPDIPP